MKKYSAKEMFEELGYTYQETNLSYEYVLCRMVASDTVREEIISFSKTFKGTIQFYAKNIRQYENDRAMHSTVDTKIIKAIQKQIEELGWLD